MALTQAAIDLGRPPAQMLRQDAAPKPKNPDIGPHKAPEEPAGPKESPIAHKLAEIAPDRTKGQRETFNLNQDTEIIQAEVVVRHFKGVRDALDKGTLTPADLTADAFTRNFMTDFTQKVEARLAKQGKNLNTATDAERDNAIGTEALEFVSLTENVEYANVLVEQHQKTLELATNARVYGPSSGRFDPLSRETYISHGSTIGGPRTILPRNLPGTTRQRVARKFLGNDVRQPLQRLEEWVEDMGNPALAARLRISGHATQSGISRFAQRRRGRYADRHRNLEIGKEIEFWNTGVGFGGLTPVERAIARSYQLELGDNLDAPEQTRIAKEIDSLVNARVDFYDRVGLQRADMQLDLSQTTLTPAQRAQTHTERQAALALGVGATMEQQFNAKRDLIQTRSQERATRRLQENARIDLERRTVTQVDQTIAQLERRAELTTDKAEKQRLDEEIKLLNKEKTKAATKKRVEDELEATQTQVDEIKAQINDPALIVSYEGALTAKRTAENNLETHKNELALYQPAYDSIKAIRDAASRSIAGLSSAKDPAPSIAAINADRDAQIALIQGRFTDDIDTKVGSLGGLIQQCDNDIARVARMETDQPLLKELKVNEKKAAQKTALLGSVYATVRTDEVIQEEIDKLNKKKDALSKPDQFQARRLETYRTYRSEFLNHAKHEAIEQRAELADRVDAAGNSLLEFHHIQLYSEYPPAYLRTLQICFGDDILRADRIAFEKAMKLLPPDQVADMLGIPRLVSGEVDIAAYRALAIVNVNSPFIHHLQETLRSDAVAGTLAEIPLEQQNGIKRISGLQPDAAWIAVRPIIPGGPAGLTSLEAQIYHYDGTVSDLASQVLQIWETLDGHPAGTYLALDDKVKDANAYALVIHNKRRLLTSQAIGYVNTEDGAIASTP